MTDISTTDARPFSYFETYELTVTSASADRQIMRAPWPIDMYAELISVSVSNPLASAGQVVMWDQDLSNSTPTTRGSAGQALAVFSIGGAAFSGQSSTGTISSPPQTRFYGGIACQASIVNMGLAVTVRLAR